MPPKEYARTVNHKSIYRYPCSIIPIQLLKQNKQFVIFHVLTNIAAQKNEVHFL